MSNSSTDEISETRIWSNEKLIAFLQQHGYAKVYESKNDTVIVEQSSQVKVSVAAITPLDIRLLYPRIGNSIHLLSTLLFAILFFLLKIPFSVFLAAAAGQIISYSYYLPKARALKKTLEDLLLA